MSSVRTVRFNLYFEVSVAMLAYVAVFPMILATTVRGDRAGCNWVRPRDLDCLVMIRSMWLTVESFMMYN